MIKNYIYSTLLCFIFSSVVFAQSNSITIDSELTGDLYLGNPTTKELVIIIAGSGPTNRNGNQPPQLKTNAYKLLAEGLQANGINVFTYDKRIIAQLKKGIVDESKGVFEDNVTDLNLIINHFKKEYPQQILLGHSEGALVANLAAIDNPTITKYISLCGPGESIDRTLYKQLTKQAPFLATKIDEIQTELKAGRNVTDVPQMLFVIYRPSVQPYLISWMKYDPVVEIKKLTLPILLIQGDKDLQVDLQQGKNLKEAKPKATLTTLAGMNHVLKSITDDTANIASYNKPELPLQSELITTISTFLKQ